MGMIMGLNVLLSSERRMSAIMALTCLPWLVVVLVTAGALAALNFIGYAIIVLACGYAIASVALPTPERAWSIVLAPALGILALSAFTAFWVRLGLPVIWVWPAWLGLFVVGAAFLWKDYTRLAKCTVSFGGALVLLSVLISAVYLLPMARKDAVLRGDGSYNWIYPDSQFNFSIAAAVRNANGTPREPGTVTEEIFYHFGPYAPSAAISRITGLDLGDAYARVTRGAALWALVLSCFGLGTLLSIKATGEKFGGITCVVGLFFYGALLALFTDERNSSSRVTGALLFKIPGVDVKSDGGPFSHFILGHSLLHAFGAITAILALCLLYRELEGPPKWRDLILLALPALAVPANSVGSLYCFGAVSVLLFWGRLRSMRPWLLLLMSFLLFLVAWKIMGYGNAPDSAETALKVNLPFQWWTLAVWFSIGLGLRIIGLRWISKPLRDPVSALVLASVVGLLAFFLFVHFQNGQEVYGTIFLQCLLSIFAFSRLKSGFWRGAERSQLISEWLSLAKTGMFVLAICGALIAVGLLVTHTHADVAHFRVKLLLFFLSVLVLFGVSAVMKQRSSVSTAASAVLLGALGMGFLTWIVPWANYGLGRMKMDVTLMPGEVKGLRRLDELAAPGDVFATNKHNVESIPDRPMRSYAYAALAEHPVLLEGYLFHTPTDSPSFRTLIRGNDLMFTTTDPQVLRDVAKIWHVRWLVARPGTDIALSGSLPPWLVKQQNCGDLKIYRIN